MSARIQNVLVTDDTITVRLDISSRCDHSVAVAALQSRARSKRSRRMTTLFRDEHLADGRTICVPLAWSWRLSAVTPEQRSRFEIIGHGSGVRWPDVDE